MKYPNKKTAPIEELIRLRETGLTLQEIADNYGVSRERIRQLIGNTGSYTKYVINNVNINEKMTTKEATAGGRAVCAIRKMMSKIHHKTDGNEYCSRGANAELGVSEMLKTIGINNQLMPSHHSFDILLDNGLRVDVKCTFTNSVLGKKQKCKIYSFGIKKDKRGDYCDFFIFLLHDTQEYFIVPSDKFNNVEKAYITWPKAKTSWKSWDWDKYYNNFDLLR